jgi:hypothetical protein
VERLNVHSFYSLAFKVAAPHAPRSELVASVNDALLGAATLRCIEQCHTKCPQ